MHDSVQQRLRQRLFLLKQVLFLSLLPKQTPFGANGREEEGVGVDDLVADGGGDVVGEGEGDGVGVSVAFCSCRLPLEFVTELTSSKEELVNTSITAHVKPPPLETEINDVGVTVVFHVSVVSPPPPPLLGIKIVRVALIELGKSILSGTYAIDDVLRPEKLERSPQQYRLPIDDIAHV